MRLLKALFIGAVCGGLGFESAAQDPGESEKAGDSGVVPAQLLAEVVTIRTGAESSVRHAFLNSGTNRLGFILSDNLRLDASVPGKVLLVQNDTKFYIAIRILGDATSSNQGCNPTSCQNLIHQNYPGAFLNGEPAVAALGQTGKAFDLQWKVDGVVNRFVRVAYVPIWFGIMEVSLVADPKAENEGILNFTGLMQQLKSNQHGRLVMPVERPLGYN